MSNANYSYHAAPVDEAVERSVIVVEDDINTALAVSKAVSTLGFSVSIARSVEEAKALIDRLAPDLVILDVSLPDGDGLQLMQESDSRFVIITGDSTQEIAIRSLRLKAVDFLLKPVSLDALRAAVTHAVADDATNDSEAAKAPSEQSSGSAETRTTGQAEGNSPQTPEPVLSSGLPLDRAGGVGKSDVISMTGEHYADADAEVEPVESMVGKTFWQVEKELLQATLKHHEGDKKSAAKTLGISLKTLYNRLNAYSVKL